MLTLWANNNNSVKLDRKKMGLIVSFAMDCLANHDCHKYCPLCSQYSEMYRHV